MTTRGRTKIELPSAFLIKSCNMLVVMSKSAITPSFSGRTATIEPGVLPMTSLASCPTNLTESLRTSTATTDGSRMMMPFPFMKIRVFAVPRSIPMSFVKKHKCVPPLIFLVYSNFVKLLKKFCIYPADLSAADRADSMRQNICISRILYPLTWDFSTCQTEKFSEFFRFFL